MRIAQDDKYQGDDWWQWSIWIDGSPKELQSIAAVTYTLHTTFQDPVRRVTDRRTKFRLETVGWGEFTIYARVDLKDGKSRKLSHDLQLHYPEKHKAAPALIRISEARGKPTQQVESLRSAILDVAPNAVVSTVETPSTGKPRRTKRPNLGLSVALTAPTVAAVAKGLQWWLGRNIEVKLELVTDAGKSVQSITSDNVAKIMRSAMAALRK
jgi:hypothetical protein